MVELTKPGPFVGPALTMVAAVELFKAKANIDPRRRALIAADVACAIKNLPGLGLVEANGHAVRPYLDKLGSSKRDKNIRSNIRLFVKWLAGVLPPELRQTQLSHGWGSLLALGGQLPYKIAPISRFARYCSTKGIAPSQISNHVVDDYILHIVNLSSVQNVVDHRRTLVCAWNGCVAKVAGWPSVLLENPNVAKPLLFPRLEDLGEPLIGEITACFVFLGQPPETVVNGKRKKFDRLRYIEGGEMPGRKALGSCTV